MSYSITFKNITEEEISKFEVGNEVVNAPISLNLLRYELLELCMKYNGNIYDFITTLTFKIRKVVLWREMQAKKFLYDEYYLEDENQYEVKGEITLEGSTYRGNFEDNEDLISFVTEQLFISSVLIGTPDYFDEAEKWSEKYNSISEMIDHLMDSSYTNVLLKFKSDYYKHSDEYEENNN